MSQAQQGQRDVDQRNEQKTATEVGRAKKY